MDWFVPVKCYKKYTPAALAAALEAVIRKEMTVKDACAHYGIPFTTLNRKIRLQKWSSEKPTWTDIRIQEWQCLCSIASYLDFKIVLSVLLHDSLILVMDKQVAHNELWLVPHEREVISLCTDTTWWIFWWHLSSE